MGEIRTACPGCRISFNADEKQLGKEMTCDTCSTKFRVAKGLGIVVSEENDSPQANHEVQVTQRDQALQNAQAAEPIKPTIPVNTDHNITQTIPAPKKPDVTQAMPVDGKQPAVDITIKQDVDQDIAQTITAPVEMDAAEIQAVEKDVPVEWDVGDEILDIYKVTDILGEGGFGKVYKVHHKNWNMDLAVKSPLAKHVMKPGVTDNFIKECETWINLGLHPHIVSCHYVRTLGGIPRVFAEYVDGGSLNDWIRDNRLYEGGKEKALERILDIAIQFAWGLQYAHEKPLIHQDIKPANVMMTKEGEVKVTDFGLAKARGATEEKTGADSQQNILVSSGGMTPAYCSPEQAEIIAQKKAGIPSEEQSKLTLHTDIWSWSVSVFEMFCGKPPCQYGGQLAAEVFESYLECKAEEEEEYLPEMPDSLCLFGKRV